MKTRRLFLPAALALSFVPALPAMAGQSMITSTYMPLMIYPDSHIEVTRVVCMQWNAVDDIDLIPARYVPPSDHPEHSTEDLNVASLHGVKFFHSDGGARDYSELGIDLTGFSAPGADEAAKVEDVRACLECLRLCCAGDKGFGKTTLTFKCADADRPWVTKLVAEFNAHDRSKPFYPAPTAPAGGGH